MLDLTVQLQMNPLDLGRSGVVIRNMQGWNVCMYQFVDGIAGLHVSDTLSAPSRYCIDTDASLHVVVAVTKPTPY